jgi:hypothetical protein
MKRRIRNILTVGLFLAAGVAAMLVWNAQKVGRTLDSYRGVPVYDNGLIFFRSYGRHYSADGYYYGQKWECVEFIKRFFYDAKGHQMPDVWGHAKSFFDENLADGAFNVRRGLAQYRNGSSEKPAPDDLLVFTDTKYGHVGVVTETGPDFVEIIQQNIIGRTRQRFSLITSNGHFYVTEPRQPAGWLRKTSPDHSVSN